METRENELHEPIIRPRPEAGEGIVVAKCSVCGYFLAFAQGENIEEATERVKERLKEKFGLNYCPECGARLREDFGFDCPFGGDETDDCADCAYSGDYHFVDGECVEREPNEK